MRNYLRLGVDVAWVALAALLALLIRENFVPSAHKVQAIVPYILLSVASAAVVFSLARLQRTVWRYTSLVDALHLIAAITIALLLALLAGFAFNKLQDIARSVPVIHWLVLVVGMVGTRVAVRLWQQRTDKWRIPNDASTRLQHVLIVGVNDLTELYLSSIAEFARAKLSVVGILSRGRGLHGRLVRQHKVLGGPEDVLQVIAQLEVHGVSVDRIVVIQPFEQLSRAAQEALLDVERVSAIHVEWWLETLGWSGKSSVRGGVSTPPEKQTGPTVDNDVLLPRLRYARLRRVLDFTSALCLIVALSPILALVAILVASDVGLPVVFWQQRPGRGGRPFKLYKYRTMHPAHDAQGNRLADELRSSNIGNLLRRSRLDELPQLYNILMGEMSLVGPRPLLQIDQPQKQMLRLLVRPGLTGWAQVNGGREISTEDKEALDIWYITNASLWLDITILLRTLAIVICGDRINASAVNAAHARLQEMEKNHSAKGVCSASIGSEPFGAQEAAGTLVGA